jgi:hypothetical protein
VVRSKKSLEWVGKLVIFYIIAQLSHDSQTQHLQKYAFALDIANPRIVWVDGPYPASASDITIFRGGTVKEGMEKWDRNALYWKMAALKKLVADGGYAGEPEKILIQSRSVNSFLRRIFTPYFFT